MAINFFHGDCMEYMKDKPDGFYDLAVVDPPYGGVNRLGGAWSVKYTPQKDEEINKSIEFWDCSPPKQYFDELFRVSKNQIIWGGNYFNLPPYRCFLVWRKYGVSETFSTAMAELAWTSFNANAKVFEAIPQGTPKNPRFHPTQKPVKLYKWCIGLFAEKGWRLLDTHGGSMSSAVAAYEMGLDMDICEINDFYFQKGKERVEKAQRQQFLF